MQKPFHIILQISLLACLVFIAGISYSAETSRLEVSGTVFKQDGITLAPDGLLVEVTNTTRSLGSQTITDAGHYSMTFIAFSGIVAASGDEITVVIKSSGSEIGRATHVLTDSEVQAQKVTLDVVTNLSTGGANVAALSLDGNGDYVTVPDNPTLNFGEGQNFTFEAQIRSSASNPLRGDGQRIISKQGGGGLYHIRIAGDNSDVPTGLLEVEVISTKGFTEATSTSLVNDGKWHHIAAVRDGTQLKVYMDGQLEKSVATNNGAVLNSDPLNIGRLGWSGLEEEFNGLIDEVRIWNIARTPSEIQAAMNRPLTGNETGLVAYYRFDALENLGVGGDGLTDDARDWSDNGNHGDLVGDATLVPAGDLPLPVEFSAFSAISKDSAVTLRWRTETETNNLGFNLYRSDTPDGESIKVNAKLVQGAGTDATPHDYSFTDDSAEVGKTYYYSIEDVDFSGKTHKSHLLKVTFDKQSLKIHLIPPQFALLQNYPNPFNPETWIPYQLASASKVELTIFNAQGRVMRTLALGQKQAGYYLEREKAAYWDGQNESGEPVASGAYFYRLQAETFSAVRKMVILK